ncbi:hypothetical protein SETIT_9G272500v2 [Setaria italica]|uniref:Uncharacterized protein n=1 Tax=Setaria italica TaxID=4555 RepID=A0A368SL42_SETIT|nr:hypothetical protein SETIT_9G272500v2 [Setaria italica]
MHTKPLLKDIYLAVQNRYGASAQPTKIASFPPDFILYFPTPHIRETVLSHGSMEGPNFTLSLSPWTNEYRCQKIPYNTMVAVNTEGIPPQASVKECLSTLLRPYRNI